MQGKRKKEEVLKIEAGKVGPSLCRARLNKSFFCFLSTVYGLGSDEKASTSHYYTCSTTSVSIIHAVLDVFVQN